MKIKGPYYVFSNSQTRNAIGIEVFTKIDDKKCLRGYSGTIIQEDGLFIDIS